jgi:stage II sporulation protein D
MAVACGGRDASPIESARDAVAKGATDLIARASELVVPRSADDLPRGYAQRAIADVDAGYGSSTAPASIVEGGEAPVQVKVTNTGSQRWPSTGPDRVRLGYHWYDGNGNVVVWDGTRSDLDRDIAPGQTATFLVTVRAPRASGTFFLDFDLVQEGAGWFSSRGVAMKAERVVVGDGVTFYGKGWGHGVGLSQWGAQGWAQGAAGPRLNGEQIVQKYFPGSELTTHPASLPIRVLLSAPSTGCVGRSIGDYARMWSAGGFRVVDDGDPTVVYANVGPYHALRFYAYGSTLVVTDEWTGGLVVRGPGSVTVVPTQWWDPIEIDQKGLAYRGNIKVGTRDEGYLRVVNYVSSDDYMKGALPGEMPEYWEFEALRAQAITARTYAAWRQSTAGDRTWDVRDDTADQCYGGHSFESARTTSAVASTASKVLTYDGKPIRALYSSAHGGVSENVGCVLDAKKVGITWECADEWPYLAVVEDPAELNARDIRGRNPHDVLWKKHFSGAEIREQVLEDYGFDIGSFVSMEFNLSPGGRPVSVRVRGSNGWVDLKGDRFLRQTLGLKSTLVRTTPF